MSTEDLICARSRTSSPRSCGSAPNSSTRGCGRAQSPPATTPCGTSPRRLPTPDGEPTVPCGSRASSTSSPPETRSRTTPTAPSCSPSSQPPFGSGIGARLLLSATTTDGIRTRAGANALAALVVLLLGALLGLLAKSSPSAAWKSQEWPDPGYSWPGGYYEGFWEEGSAAARLLDKDEIDGVASRVVAFVRPDVSAWFKLWVGVDDGLVRRMEMTAEGHLMTHDYRQFNAPVEIRPPM